MLNLKRAVTTAALALAVGLGLGAPAAYASYLAQGSIFVWPNLTVRFTNPSGARIITFPDPGANANVVMAQGVTFDRTLKTARVALAAADTGGGVVSWVNPETAAIIVTRLTIDATTASTGACTVDAGVTASSATTSADNLIDGLDVNAAAGVFDNVENQGTNGKASGKIAVGKWLTVSRASGAAAGLVGYAYITYLRI